MADGDGGLENTRVTGGGGQRYLIRTLVEMGSFSRWYLCVDEDNRRRYLCEVFRLERMSRDDLERMIRMTELLNTLNYASVLTPRDMFQTEQYLIIIYYNPIVNDRPDVVFATDLLDKMQQRGRFNEDDAREIILQLVRGVEYLHSQGICHRDLKLENIRCSPQRDHFLCTISGYHLATHFGPDHLMREACGTPNYTAPEVFNAHLTPYTEACDIWSLGVITYALLTGCFPFHHVNPENLRELIRDGRFNQ